MTATVNAAINQESSQIDLNEILAALAGYNDESEHAPIEQIQSLRVLTRITVKDFEKIHNALLIAYNVIHARKPEVRPAIISSVRLLAINNNTADHVINTNKLKKWVETGLDIIDDQSVYPNDYLLSAAIALVRDQWGKIPLVQRNKNQVDFRADISLGTQDKREEFTEDTQARVLRKCIAWMDNSSPFVCSAATSLLSKQWRSLSENQQSTVLEKSIENLDAMPTHSVAALLLLNKQWLALSDQQQEAVINKSIDLVDADPEVSCAAISLISHHLPINDEGSELVANKSKLILERSNNVLQRLAAAHYATNYIENSPVSAEKKAGALRYFQGLSRNSGADNPDEVAIFTEALQTLQVQAGVGYSQTPITTQPSATNGNGHTWPTRAADSHQPATSSAALARAALVRPSR